MTTSLEGWPTKTKKAPFPKVRMAPLDTNLVFLHISKVCPIWNYTWKHYFYFTFVCFHGTTILQKFRKKTFEQYQEKIDELLDLAQTDTKMHSFGLNSIFSKH